MYFREMIFGQELESPKRQSGGWLIAVLAIALLLGLAWHYGLVISIALALKDFGVGIWNMLCDFASSCGDFLQFVLSRLSH